MQTAQVWQKLCKEKLPEFPLCMGPPNNIPVHSTTHCEDTMLQYCKSMSVVFSQVSEQVGEALPPPASTPLCTIQPRDWVIIKELRKKH